MARQTKARNKNPYIIVFWEGESEMAYMKFMRREFHEKANVKINKIRGVFQAAVKAFSTKGEYKDELKDIDEIWFLFDTEPDMRNQWEEYFAVVQKVRKQCKNARVRLLMTKSCIEYFFLLHYEKTAPSISNPSDKDLILKRLKDNHCPSYSKGDMESTFKIASHYMMGIQNGRWSLNRIANEIGNLQDSDERNRRLLLTDCTFTNVHEGIEYLLSLKKYEC